MLPLPKPPTTDLTLQIRCISCQEPFTISEGQATTNFRPPPYQPFVELRFRPNLRERETSPFTLPHTHSSTGRETAVSPTHLNCPRCGTDNRNWVHLLHPPEQPKTGWLAIRQWQLSQRFPPALGGILLVCIGSAITPAALIFLEPDTAPATLLLAVASLATGLFIIHYLTNRWERTLTLIRQKDHLARFSIRTGKDVWAPPIYITIFTALILPALLYYLIPVGINFMTQAATIPSPPSLAEEVQTLANTIDALLPQVQGNEKLKSLLLNLPTKLREISPLPAEPEKPTSTISRLKVENMPRKFLVSWVITVLASGLVGIFFGSVAVFDFVRQANANLPNPIFHNIASLTRVVIWEARRALEIQDNLLFQIQWTAVQRNHEGGINLTGIYRADPEFDAQGQPLNQRILVQTYTIESDMWGHIINAQIQDKQTTRSAVSPSFIVTGQDVFGTPLSSSFNPIDRLPPPAVGRARR